MYYPPRATGSREARYKKTVGVLTAQLDEVLQGLPRGCTPIVVMDLNDGMGKKGEVYYEGV
eukprot:4240180-Lingulodinium_polyedra.AAC.1